MIKVVLSLWFAKGVFLRFRRACRLNIVCVIGVLYWVIANDYHLKYFNGLLKLSKKEKKSVGEFEIQSMEKGFGIKFLSSTEKAIVGKLPQLVIFQV